MDKNLKIALILSATDKASGVLNKAFHNAEGRAKHLLKVGKEIGEVGEKAMFAGAAITAAFGETVHMAEEAQKEARKLDAAFANVGKRGKEIAEQGKKFAEGYQLQIGVKDDEIEAAETKLAVFHHLFTENAIQAKLFERATKAAFDMQALGFGEAAGNAQKLGKLLNDPINNLNALGKVLGRVSPQQKEHIANLYAQNKLTQAQAYVLELVEKKFRNAAVSTASASAKMGVALHQAGVKIGNTLLPIYTSLVGKFIAIVPRITGFIDRHQKLIKYLAAGGIGLLGFGIALKGLGMIVSTVGRIFKVYQGVVWAVERAMNFGQVIQKLSLAFTAFGETLLANPITLYIAAAVALAAVAYLIIKNWDKISAFFKSVWKSIKVVFAEGWNFVKNTFLNYAPLGIIIKNWGKISAFFVNIWKGIKHAFSAAWDWLSNLGTKFFQAGKNIVIAIAKGIWATTMAPIRAIEYMVKKIRNFLPFSPAKEGPLRDIHRVKIVETIAASMNAKPLLKAWGNATSQLRTAMIQRPAYAPISSLDNGMQIHYNPVINLHGTATAADGRRLSAELKQQFDRMMKDYEHRSGRVNY